MLGDRGFCHVNGRRQEAGGRRVFLHPFPLWDRFPVF